MENTVESPPKGTLIANVIAVSPAAVANHFSWSRSSPVEPLNRTTVDANDVRIVRGVGAGELADPEDESDEEEQPPDAVLGSSQDQQHAEGRRSEVHHRVQDRGQLPRLGERGKTHVPVDEQQDEPT